MNDFINSCEKLKLEYPCEWTYKVIGLNQKGIEHAMKEIIPHTGYQLSLGNQSAGGKYISMTLVIEVSSDEERLGLFEKLKNHAAIKFVI